MAIVDGTTRENGQRIVCVRARLRAAEKKSLQRANERDNSRTLSLHIVFLSMMKVKG
jgi:hypothetical protein